jgi:hypothetical protein
MHRYVLGAMLGYNVQQETKGSYGGYPRWATSVFGWILCVLGPLSFVAFGFFRPLHLERPTKEAGVHAGNDGDGGDGDGGWGESGTEMAGLNRSSVRSDEYREEEARV